ncbi:hypothetical protein RHGRI_005523 [Rhododendron griersonianum]|uniref:Uncharacterized protein n=1 Tax=Rhododendron griersonianum TaxID=479676 RepID=A0AAV6LCL3_9ERIC|nr:hypothetical protein RHGRI_005523 [Rhododendron griersonianum]
MFLFLLLFSESCTASVRKIGKVDPGFHGTQMNWIDNNGIILLSNDSNFGFGFTPTTQDVTLFLLTVIHMGSSTIVWAANRASLVHNSDNFYFDDTGNAYLQSGGSTVWSSDTGGKGVSAMGLLDSGNLVLLGKDDGVVWQSFSHPTDTLLSNQEFSGGMRLVSAPDAYNLSYFLEIKSADMILSAGFQTPQPYWSMSQENRKTINQNGGVVSSASLEANSWKFYDSNKILLWQFIFLDSTDVNATWVAVLGNDGFITFSVLQSGGPSPSPTKIPNNPCGTPEPCGPYYVCYSDNRCQCPSVLNPNCKPGIVSSCDRSKGPIDLVQVGDTLNYFALGFVSPVSKTNLDGCKAACHSNCSCLTLFFDNSSGNCFLFDSTGSFQNVNNGGGFVSFTKVLSTGGSGNNTGGGSGNRKKGFPYVVIIAVATVVVIIGLLSAGYWYWRRKTSESPKDSSEEDNFLEGISGMPIRFGYRDLQTATNNFCVKLGQGGFGSVYQGALPDGTRLAVKKLEGIEGKLRSILDSKLELDEEDERLAIAVKVALWCIQDDMQLRPSMTKVVQMLEGISVVPPPPMASQSGSRLYSSFFKSASEEGTSSGPSDCNSDAIMSAVRLSGPR